MRKTHLTITICIAIIVVGVIAGAFIGGFFSGITTPKKKILKIAMDQDINGYSPQPGGLWQLGSLIYDCLVELDENWNQVPGLAKSWEISSDGKIWTFHLREGVKFHDGTELDSEDVKVTFENMPYRFGNLVFLEKVECPDKYTVKLYFKKPCYTIASDVAVAFSGIISSTAFENGKIVKPIGTGPFKLVKWVKGEKIVLEKNKDYWAGEPKIDEIIVKIIPDPDARVMALEAGEVDLIYCRGLLPAMSRLEENPDITVKSKPGQGNNVIYLNTFIDPLNSVKVRKAIAYAINKEAISSLIGKYAHPAHHILSPAFGKYVNMNVKLPEYNPEKAKILLAEEGWEDSNGDGILDKNGKPLKLKLTFQIMKLEHKLVAEAVKNQLKKVGIEVILDGVDYPALREKYYKKDFDLLLKDQWYIPHDNPYNYYFANYYSKGFIKIFTSKQLDKLLNEMSTCLNPERHLQLHHLIQEEIAKNIPEIDIYYYETAVAMNKKVINFILHQGFWRAFKPLAKTDIAT